VSVALQVHWTARAWSLLVVTVWPIELSARLSTTALSLGVPWLRRSPKAFRPFCPPLALRKLRLKPDGFWRINQYYPNQLSSPRTVDTSRPSAARRHPGSECPDLDLGGGGGPLSRWCLMR
jgi:hypothetical protein